MSSLIKEARARHDVGVRELARRCGVSAPTVVGWERSEAAQTIQSGTLARVLGAMGETLELASTRENGPFRPLERREQRLGLELHRAVARRLVDNPERVLESAAGNIHSIRAQVQGGAKAWIDRWEDLIARRHIGQLVDIMLGTTQADIDMRSVSPFVGLLQPEERIDVLRRATAA